MAQGTVQEPAGYRLKLAGEGAQKVPSSEEVLRVIGPPQLDELMVVCN